MERKQRKQTLQTRIVKSLFGKREAYGSILSLLLTSVFLVSNADVKPAVALQSDHTATSEISMVATVNPLATDAGIAALDAGGNAVDAAIAAALTLGVVDGFNSGIGGGCLILIRTADGKIIAIDGREMAPQAASRDMYLRDGKTDRNLSQIGALASGVPGALAAYERAVREHGKLEFSKLLVPAANIAEQGFVISSAYEKSLRATAHQLRDDPGASRVLLKPSTARTGDPQVYTKGDVLKQVDLARTYRQIAKEGLGWFYQGEFAERTAQWMKANKGIITAKDFANYKTVIRNPIRTTYRGYEIVGFPPPSSGGVHVAQILNILESFDLKKIHADDPVKLKHVVAEAMKLAFADRAYWLGDSDYVNVPRGLIDKKYAAELAKRIDLDKASTVTSHGTPPRSDGDFFGKHTTHVAAADKAGNWVAITTTVNTTFGSKVIVPGLGVIMNNQMDDFSIAPGTPNAFGLVGGENNAIAPGKRPLSSMSPTIVLKDGKPVMTVGAAGGPTIITQAVWAIINHLDLGMNIGDAIARPRLHHQWSPDRLLVEDALNQKTSTGLAAKGHTIDRRPEIGISQAITYDANNKKFVGAHDPRTPGKARGQTQSDATQSDATKPDIAKPGAGPITSPKIVFGNQFPEVLAVKVSRGHGNRWRFDVTLSSKYDTRKRYADAWRVLDDQNKELGVRVLGHDHASEQPFTRSGTFEIPQSTQKVFIEGRDQANGWSGQRFEFKMP